MNDLRYDVIQTLKSTVMRTPMSRLAREYGVTISKTTGANKGWVGQTLDKAAGTLKRNGRWPDGDDYELKSVCGSIHPESGMWEPRETMAITMLSPENVLRETFEVSALWHKLSRLILVAHTYEGATHEEAFVKKICPIDVSDPRVVAGIKAYWELIQQTVRDGRIAEYSSKGTSGGFIQLRTKGPGGEKGETICPVTRQKFKSRAFYATKPFLRYVLGL
jgi:DNA mismatch repair protein MutH